EEFVMVAPNTDLATARMLAERLRACVVAEPYTLGTLKSQVTISVGVAGTEIVTEGSFDELLVSADRALYRAKQEGRNRFHIQSVEDMKTDQDAEQDQVDEQSGKRGT